jgi:hypothetical protein
VNKHQPTCGTNCIGVNLKLNHSAVTPTKIGINLFSTVKIGGKIAARKRFKCELNSNKVKRIENAKKLLIRRQRLRGDSLR